MFIFCYSVRPYNKIIPYIINGMIISESLIPLDIAKVLKDDFSLVQLQSVVKRIKRLFANKHFNPYDFSYNWTVF